MTCRIALLALMWCTARASGQSLVSKDGNLVFTGADGTSRQITASGHDSAPSLSPDGRLVVFVRDTPQLVVDSAVADGPLELKELWRSNTDGTGARRLLRGKVCPHRKQAPRGQLVCVGHGIAAISNPQFSHDGRTIFFLARNLLSADGDHLIYAVGVQGGTARLVTFGHSLEVIRGGAFRGCLIVQKAKRFVGPGGYDFFWLVRPDGCELEEPLGGDESDVVTFKEIFGETGRSNSNDGRLGSACAASWTNCDRPAARRRPR